MMGDKTTTQKNQSSQTGRTESQATPYGKSQPLFDASLGRGEVYYDATSNPRLYADYFNTGSQGIAKNARAAMDDNPVGGMMDSFSSTFGNGGYNTEQRDALSYLNPTARGDFVNLDNPDFQRLLNRSMEDASTEASMVASGMGRSGSDFHQGLVADRVGDMSANARLGQYNLERDRQNAAIQQLFGMGQTGMSNTAAAPGLWEALLGAQDAPSASLMALGATPASQIEGALGATSAALPFARSVGVTSGTATGTGSQTQPNNTFGQIAGAGLGLGSLLFG